MALRAPDVRYQARANVLATPYTFDAVTLTEFKQHLRIAPAEDEEDLYIMQLLTDAAAYIESYTGLAIGTQIWTLWLDGWPGYAEPWWNGMRDGARAELYSNRTARGVVEFPRFPLVTVDEVAVYDEDSNETLATIADVFDIDTASTPGRLALKRGGTWPIATRAVNAVKITYTAGFGTTAIDVPSPVKRAIMLMATSVYTHRGDGCTLAEGYKKSGAQSWLAPYVPARL